jgi:hypothetical protein
MNNFNPKQWQVATANAGGLPPANYKGEFVGAEHLPAEEPNEATGRKGKEWPSILFKWEITEGEHKGRTATRETPVGTTAKCGFAQVCGLVMGKPLAAKDAVNLNPFVGKNYLLQIANKTDKHGNPTAWTHVVNAMLTP